MDLTGDLRALMATDALRPYSRIGVPRPFDSQANGPVPGEGAVARFIAGWLERAGLEVRLDEVRPGRPNVVGVARGTGVVLQELDRMSRVLVAATYARPPR